MPRVSVVVSAHNSSKTITQAIHSIMTQTYNDWECVVFDDASDDNTWEIISNFKENYPDKFICIKNSKENRGPAHGRNCCIDSATGEYIAIQDADDVSMPERLAKQVEFLDRRPDLSAVGTYAVFFDDRENEWGINKPRCQPSMKDWIQGTQVIHASAMMRKKDLLSVGKYEANLRRVEDYDLWLRMVLNGYKIETIPVVLYKIRASKEDYGRRALKYRWDEVKIKYRFAKQANLPLSCFIYLAKPIINGIIPPKMMYFYHKYKFGKG